MPAVGDLDGFRRAAGSPFGVAACPVPANQLHPGAACQPGGEGVSRPFRQDVDRAAGLDIDQQSPVTVAPAQRELIDAQHPRRLTYCGVRQGTDQPDQRHPTHPGR